MMSVKIFLKTLVFCAVFVIAGCSLWSDKKEIITSSSFESADVHIDADADTDTEIDFAELEGSDEGEDAISAKAEGGKTASAKGLSRGLVSDVRERKYDDSSKRKEPSVVRALEETKKAEKPKEVKEPEKQVAKKEDITPRTSPIEKVSEAPVAPVKTVGVQNSQDDIEDFDDFDEEDDDFFADKPAETMISKQEPVKEINEEQFAVSKPTSSTQTHVSTLYPSLEAYPDENFDEIPPYKKSMIDVDKTFESLGQDSFATPFPYDVQSEGFVTERPDVVLGENTVFDLPENEFQTNGLSSYRVQENKISFLAGVVYHEHGSSKIDNDGLKTIKEIAKQAKEMGATVRVVGHASSRTANLEPVRHMMANFSISLDRARAVTSRLISSGIKSSNIYVGAASDGDPVYYESMPLGEKRNRRTEIYLDY